MYEDKHDQARQIARRTERLKEEIEFELKIAHVPLTVHSVEPMTKSATVSGTYPDYLLGKQVAKRHGWDLDFKAN